jgi:hypothetical protein
VGDCPVGPGIQDGHEISVKGAFIWPARVGSPTEETSDVVQVIRGRAAALLESTWIIYRSMILMSSLRCS